MPLHPFLKSKKRLAAVIGWTAGGVVIQCYLLMHCEAAPLQPALIDSFISTGILAGLSFLLWYSIESLEGFPAQVLLTLLVMTVWLTGSYGGELLATAIFPSPYPIFESTLITRLIFGILMWAIIVLWYRVQKLQSWQEERKAEEIIQTIQNEDTIDRIAVKDRGKIHIIPLHELIYLQATGDYVTLFTSSNGQYLKEQTMKFFEGHLPSSQFIRIHRSYIINIDYVDRVELMGKETYQLLLKNGISLRISNTGYKLLKEQLSI